MGEKMHIKSPVEWFFAQFQATAELGAAHPADYFATPAEAAAAHGTPIIREVLWVDLMNALRAGVSDFAAARTDVVFLILIYPVAVAVIAAVDAQHALLPLLFPVASGFALIGPLFAVGLYEMSRQRELTGVESYLDTFKVLRSPQLGEITLMGLILIGLFLVWLGVAQAIFNLTLGGGAAVTIIGFVTAVLTTPAGWAMIVIGSFVGFLFAAGVLAISVVTFPLLLDRHVSLGTAISTSLLAVRRNKVALAQWGMIVSSGLVIGAIPCFLGLIIVLPVLGHGTWHLYRRLVKPIKI
jgi:uncharacterized membrane protein